MAGTDTTEDAQRVYVAAFSRLSGGERVLLATEMAEQAKAIAIAGIRHRNPQLSDDELSLEWLRLLHGDEVANSMA